MFYKLYLSTVCLQAPFSFHHDHLYVRMLFTDLIKYKWGRGGYLYKPSRISLENKEAVLAKLLHVIKIQWPFSK